MKKTTPKGWISLALFLITLTACTTVESPALPTPAPSGTGMETSIPSLTPTPVPTATPYVVATPHRQEMASSAPLNPPEYSPSGEVAAEAAAALSTEGYWWALYEMYQAERGAKDFYAGGELTAQEVFEAQMEKFAREKGLQVFQSERPDGVGLISFPVKDNGDGTWSMWRFATPGGAFSAQPDLPPTADSTWVEVMVDGGIGGTWGEDGHFYVFRLDEQGRATHWFNAVESTTSEVVWTEVEQVQYLEDMEPEVEAAVKAVMPPLWYFNEENQLVARDTSEFTIKYMDERHLFVIALDSQGNKVAWGDFNKINYEDIIWYSVTDRSENTLMPIVFAGKMGEFKESWTVLGVTKHVDQAVIRFREEGEVWVYPEKVDPEQIKENNFMALLDESEKHLESGEAIMEAYVIRLATELYNLERGENLTVGEMRARLEQGEQVLIKIKDEEERWDVAKGLEVTWVEVAEARWVKSKVDGGTLKIKISTRGGVDGFLVSMLLDFGVPEELIKDEQAFREIRHRLIGLLDFYDLSRWQVRTPLWVEVLNR